MKYIDIRENPAAESGKKPVVFYPADYAPEKAAVYSVIVARHAGKWILCRHRDRDTWEIPGGHIEPGETPLEAARRELYEETGATRADIVPIALYRVEDHGMLYFAEVETLGPIPEDSEIAEISLEEVLPKNLTYPAIQPELFRRAQMHLNLRSGADELWDVYDGEFRPTGRTHRRGDPLPAGDHHLVVYVWIQNSRGEFLNTKRSPNKGYPNMWENTGGSALAGDDSLAAAIREVREETGLSLDPERGKRILRLKGEGFFGDVWHFRQDFDLKDVVLQEGETCDVRWATREQIEADMKAGLYIPIKCFNEIMDIMQERQI